MADNGVGQRIAYAAQAVGARVALGALGLLSLDMASTAGSMLLRAVGPFLRAHKVAERNLRRAFPDKTDAEVAAILHTMWDNLGRTLGELPHTAELRTDVARIEITGREHLESLRDDGRAGILVSAHLANWELGPAAATHVGMPVHVFFRAPNNPHVEDVYHSIRSELDGELLPKGREGAKRAIQLLRMGEHLGVLADQKMNDGIPVPFFGRDAMTAPALAQMAIKFDIPVLCARVVRLGGAHFRVVVEPPLDTPRTGRMQDDVRAMMVAVNRRIEAWIRENPGQWLWVHRRWPD